MAQSNFSISQTISHNNIKKRKIDIILVYPNYNASDSVENFRLCIDHDKDVINVGIALIASYLEDRGFAVKIIDGLFNCISTADIVNEIILIDPICVGYSLHLHNIDQSIEISSHLRRLGYIGHITAGGQYPTIYYEQLLNNSDAFNSIIIGEGEIPLSVLISFLRKGCDWEKTQSIAYKIGKSIIKNAPGNTRIDIDKQPWMKRYDLDSSNKNSIVQTIEVGRGCYGCCTFCASNRFSETFNVLKIRRKSIEAIFDEVEFLNKRYGLEIFNFSSDNFFPSEDKLISSKFVNDFVCEAKKRKTIMRFILACRANDVIQEWFLKLKQIGLITVFVGFESFVPKDLKLYNKRISPKQIINCHDILQKLCINSYYGYIFFNPFTTLAEIERHISFVKKIGISHFPYTIYDLKLHKGTPLYDIVNRKNLLFNNGDLTDGYPRYKFRCGMVEQMHDNIYSLYSELCDKACSVYVNKRSQAVLNNLKTMSDQYLFAFMQYLLEQFKICKFGKLNNEIVACKRNEFIRKFALKCEQEFSGYF